MSEDSFTPGLYEKLLAESDAGRLERLGDARLYVLKEVDPEDSHAAVAQYVEHLLASSLASFRGRDASELQRRMVDRVLAELSRELPEFGSRLRLVNPLRRLLAVHAHPDSTDLKRPDTPLSRSSLLTGSRLDPSLASQLGKEIRTADRVDILCSFIKWSGLRLMLEDLRVLVTRPSLIDGPRLRVITTSYMGATDPRAIEALSDFPNTQVKVSYDTKRTRLHAKAYVIHRSSGFGCAYVGSANLTQAALSEGLEWTSKISQYELSYLWAKISATFEAYWNDDEFELFDQSSKPKLRTAIQRERAGSDTDRSDSFVRFDLHPYPYQEEILDVFAAEREVRSRHRHLLVAATGTGKTMVAGFDYRRWSQAQPVGGNRPTLLYIAHREEILRQAMGTFRAVLRDQNFGDVLAGSHDPAQNEYLFCTIQSYNSRHLNELPSEHFDYVVIDEFHHAEAPSYQRLMNHVTPKVLLGMTATPERSDGLDVFRWFDGEASAEIRLPDAINRRLLCPFQYFGIADTVDLDGLTWQRGGYRFEDLDRLYTGNDVRAGLVLDKIRELLLDPLRARGLGFCVSVAHANFMARFFTEHGVPALALSAESNNVDRYSAQQKLMSREVNFLFVVDLYNEGVDIPQADTVLLLRPTESLTVYLQQLGRGLRLSDEKECLTVLDFIGAQNRRFRFASRLRALSTQPTVRLEQEVEDGFPHLPSGCAMQLERVAQQRVLENIRQSIHLRRAGIVSEIRELGRYLGRQPTLREALDYLHTDLDEFLRRGLWSRLLAEADLAEAPQDPDEDMLARGIRRLSHTDDPNHLQFLIGSLRSEKPDFTTAGSLDVRRLTMLFVGLFGSSSEGWTLDQAFLRLGQNFAARRDLIAVLEHRLRSTHTRFQPIDPLLSGPLALHAEYTRDEILAGLGFWTMARRPDQREGVLHIAESKVDALFVTLHKTEAGYSPTTMYEDYAISNVLFHWQSQSTTSVDTPTGQRYIRHQEQGYTPLLFVRENKQLPNGLAAPYAYLGPVEHVSHEGSRPISIVWRLRHAMPARLLRVTRQQATA